MTDDTDTPALSQSSATGPTQPSNDDGDGPSPSDGTDWPEQSTLRVVLEAVGVGIGGVLFAFVVTLALSLVVFLLNLPGLELLLGLLTIGQFLLFAVAGLWYLRWRGFTRDQIVAYLGVSRPSLRDIGLILLTWFLMLLAAGIVATVVMELLEVFVGTEAAEEGPAENPVGEFIEENPAIVPLAVAFMFLVVGPTEELLFRGVVQGRLRERLSKYPAILLASALFAIVHVAALAGQGTAAIAASITILFVPSLGFGFIYEYTGNIVVPSLLHGFHNSVIVVLVAYTAVADVEAEQAVLWGLSWLPDVRLL